MKRTTFLFVLFILFCAYSQGRSVVRFGKDVIVNSGEQVKDAVSVGGDVIVYGEVQNDAVAVGGDVKVGPDAVVGGDLVEIGTPWGSEISRRNWAPFFWGVRLFSFLGFTALALLLVALFPKQIKDIAQVSISTPGKAFLWGFIALFAILPIAFILAISIIGIILIPLEIGLLFLISFAGYTAIARQIGVYLLSAAGRKDTFILWETLLGLVLLGMIGLIPVLGWFIKAANSIFGLGATIEVLFQGRAKQTQG